MNSDLQYMWLTQLSQFYIKEQENTLTNVLFACGHTNVVKHPSQHQVIYYAALSTTCILTGCTFFV